MSPKHPGDDDAYGTTAADSTAPDQDTFVRTTTGPSVVLPEPGYKLGDMLGRGGMGEVVAAQDQRIGREVALKRMRGTTLSAGMIGRFLREARIQARLDHPAIVPVHELGVQADGRPFFTMKRLAGVTLSDRLAERGPLQPLLRAFVDVCLAIEFAHARRIVHRDLKPSNIMLGDYGEVYVLDWGIARDLDEQRRAPSEGHQTDPLDEGTQLGDVLGTPGYMSPEQMRGDPVAPASDVYALGAILFEILAGEPLHPRGTDALASTLRSPLQAPGSRQPQRDIAPELDAACNAALADEPSRRPSARELGDRVQRYLDGDRDVERRRALATEQLAEARAALESGDREARATAMRASGRALALDPESVDAARLVSSMIVEPPRELPSELVASLAEEDRRAGTERLSIGVKSIGAVLGFLVLLPWMHVKSWPNFGEFYGGVALIVVLTWITYRRGRPSALLNLVSTLVLALAFSRVIGPYMLMPAMLAGLSLPICANPWLNARPGLVISWLGFAFLLPIGLEAAGIVGPTSSMTHDGVLAISQIYSVRGGMEAFALTVANLGLVVSIAMYALNSSRRVRSARRDQLIQAWHLGQMLPAGRRRSDRKAGVGSGDVATRAGLA